MAGYLVLPDSCCDWTGADPSQVQPNPVRLGLFDLVREFEQDPFPFTRRTPVCLHGLDELLVHLGQVEDLHETHDSPLLAGVRRRLKAVASEVTNMGVIHVPIRRPLVFGGGQQLYAHLDRMNKRIPLWRLFGCHPDINSHGKDPTYLFGENLS
jgi:hypothetical protein